MLVLAGHAGPVRCLAYRPDGRTLASGGDDYTVKLWDVGAGRERSAFEGHTDGVRAVAWSPDGGHLASGGCDGELRVHGAGRRAARPSGTHAGWVWSLAFSPDGSALAVGAGDGSVWLYRPPGKWGPQPVMGSHAWPVNALAFSADGRLLASGSHDRTVRLWDGAWGRPGPVLQGHPDWVRAAAFAPGDPVLATGDDEGGVRLWPLPPEVWETRRFAEAPEGWTVRGHTELGRHPGRVTQVAFTPDSRELLSAGWDGTVRVWDVGAGRERAAFDWQIGRVHALALAPDGLTAAAAGDGRIVVWDLEC